LLPALAGDIQPVDLPAGPGVFGPQASHLS
jgi:hypothetical protein